MEESFHVSFSRSCCEAVLKVCEDDALYLAELLENGAAGGHTNGLQFVPAAAGSSFDSSAVYDKAPSGLTRRLVRALALVD